MIIQYNDKVGSVAIDVNLKSIRVFTYDGTDEWERTHQFDKCATTGIIIDGTLDGNEVQRIVALAQRASLVCISESPSDFHGNGMIQLSISDKTCLTDSKWNEDSKMDNALTKLAACLRLLRNQGRD